VALLEQRLARRAAWQVVNASISGDTTSGGRSRLPALLQQHKPAMVVIELGGNDALRGLPLA
jgi:acyl-CoA thioesterase-1